MLCLRLSIVGCLALAIGLSGGVVWQAGRSTITPEFISQSASRGRTWTTRSDGAGHSSGDVWLGASCGDGAMLGVVWQTNNIGWSALPCVSRCPGVARARCVGLLPVVAVR